ncbi:MAG: TadE/TadG family type IV pilus assembly protein [Pseudomonadota bacterium]
MSNSSRSTNSARQQAQALTEFIIIWPVLLLALCMVLQLFLLWWAQQTLDTASQYAVRAGAINHGQQAKMEMTLSAVMAGTKPQLGQDSPVAAAAEAIARQRLHFAIYGKLERLTPTRAHIEKFSQRRWDPDSGGYVNEIAVDHYHARLEKNSDPEWVEARRLKISTEWCFDLQIPLAAEFLGLIARERGQCLIGNLASRPQWPLTNAAEHELLSGFRQR